MHHTGKPRCIHGRPDDLVLAANAWGNVMTPCKHGHTSGRRLRPGRLGECIECTQLRARARQRDGRAEYARTIKNWRVINFRLDHDTAAEVEQITKATKVNMAQFVREAIEWRLMELEQ